MRGKTFFLLYALIMGLLVLSSSCKKEDDNEPEKIVKDADGNVYKTVTIGNQVWMAENLKTTKYSDGTAIPFVTDKDAWLGLSTPGYCWYDHDLTSYANIYGALYNWYTVNTYKLCPTGWHAPTNADWTTLITYLGGVEEAGGKLKESGTTHWNEPNEGATNESGFTALPGGMRYNGVFNSMKRAGQWWTANQDDTHTALAFYLDSAESDVMNSVSNKTNGFSVRCVKD